MKRKNKELLLEFEKRLAQACRDTDADREEYWAINHVLHTVKDKIYIFR